MLKLEQIQNIWFGYERKKEGREGERMEGRKMLSNCCPS